jgi:hypothetical protein
MLTENVYKKKRRECSFFVLTVVDIPYPDPREP